MSVRRNESVATSSLLLGALFWGLFWWPLKAIDAAGIHGSIVQVIAFGAATLLMLPLVWHDRAGWRGRSVNLLLVTLLGGWANASLVVALTLGDVVRVMLLFYLAPVWTILAARVMLGEPITQLRILALVLALSGLYATLGGSEIFATAPSLIDLLALSSGLAFALNNVVVRVGQGLPNSARTAAIMAGCAIISLGYMVFEGGTATQPDATQVMLLVAFGVFCVLPGTLATFYGVAHLASGKAAILLLSELVIGVVSAVLIGDAHLSLNEIFGGLLILLAAVIEIRTEAHADDSPAPPVGSIQEGRLS